MFPIFLHVSVHHNRCPIETWIFFENGKKGFQDISAFTCHSYWAPVIPTVLAVLTALHSYVRLFIVDLERQQTPSFSV